MKKPEARPKKLFRRVLLKPSDVARYFELPVKEIYKRIESGKLATRTFFMEPFVLRDSVINLGQRREQV